MVFRFTFLLFYVILEIGPVVHGLKIPKRQNLTFERSISVDFEIPNEIRALESVEKSELIDEGHKPLLKSSIDYFYRLNELN